MNPTLFTLRLREFREPRFAVPFIVLLSLRIRSALVFPPPGIARQDWKIVRALGEFVGVTLPYSDDVEMEERVNTLVPLTLNMDELSHSEVSALL